MRESYQSEANLLVIHMLKYDFSNKIFMMFIILGLHAVVSILD